MAISFLEPVGNFLPFLAYLSGFLPATFFTKNFPTTFSSSIRPTNKATSLEAEETRKGPGHSPGDASSREEKPLQRRLRPINLTARVSGRSVLVQQVADDPECDHGGRRPRARRRAARVG